MFASCDQQESTHFVKNVKKKFEFPEFEQLKLKDPTLDFILDFLTKITSIITSVFT